MGLPGGLRPPPCTRNVLETIGNTPLVEVTKIDTGPCRLFLKLENQNPGGSIKDRIGLYMIEDAEHNGRIIPGGTLLEATAGNTGIGLALVAGQKGYRLQLVIPDKMSQEKIFHLRAMGAKVIMTRSDVGKGHPAYYQDMAERLARETPGAYFINQFGNSANPLAHEETTGPEIWSQMDKKVDAVVCGVGSGGTITGLSRFFSRVSPQTEILLADPTGSVLANYVETGKLTTEVGSWLVEGIGEDFLPPICDLSRVTRAFTIPDAEAFGVCREVLHKEGIIAGTSSGTLISAALRYCRAQTEPLHVVTFVCDSGNKYLSKVYNDFWMLDQGFLPRDSCGDLRDLIARRHGARETITVDPGESLLAAYSRMKLNGISQLPVLEDECLVGLVDEEDILLRVFEDEARFTAPVSTVMSFKLVTLPPDADLESLLPIFDRGMVAIIKEGKKFLGLITRIDLLNHLRRRMK